jgi:hypothetical protein
MPSPEDLVPALSLTEGGPGRAVLQRLQASRKRTGSGAARAALVLAAVCWVPLLVLSVVEGLTWKGVRIPFLRDFAAHVRFLLSVPLLVIADLPIGQRAREAGAHFVVAGLVRESDQPKFGALIADTERLRDSRIAELIVLAAAYATSFGMIAGSSLQRGDTWVSPSAGTGLTPAGYWYELVSIPVFHFLIYRWLYRMFVWSKFLRGMAGLDLELTSSHPDGAGGLGFLGKSTAPYGVLLFALSAVVSSAIASRVLFDGQKLDSFYVTYATFVVIALIAFAGPLQVFAPKLLALKHRGLLEYGTLASRYTQLFERQWMTGEHPPEEGLLGSADIQSLADLKNGYETVQKMKAFPITLADFIVMAIPAAIPALPLAALVMPVGEIVKGLLHLFV